MRYTRLNIKLEESEPDFETIFAQKLVVTSSDIDTINCQRLKIEPTSF